MPYLQEKLEYEIMEPQMECATIQLKFAMIWNLTQTVWNPSWR